MKSFFSFLCFLFSLNISAQTIDLSWQGYVNTGADSVRASFYLADSGLDLTTAFNDRNYPYWYTENQMLAVNNGVIGTILKNIPFDTLVAYFRNDIFLYVTINGQPFDKVKIQYVPYSAFSLHALSANRAEIALRAGTSAYSDTSDYAHTSRHSDSSTHAQYSENSTNAENATRSQIAELAIVADSISDNTVTSEKIVDGAIQRGDLSDELVNESALASNSVTSAKIVDNSVAYSDMNILGEADNMSVLGYRNGNLEWISTNKVLTDVVEKTTVIPTEINANTRWVILQVALDFNLVGVSASEGKIITIVNASTANTVYLSAPYWNIYGGTVGVSPRTSKTLLYINDEWIILQ